MLKWLIPQILIFESSAKNKDILKPSLSEKKYAGIEATISGVEPWENKAGVLSNTKHDNACGDSIWCFHLPMSGAKPDFAYFDYHQNRVNIILDIAKGKTGGFSENDMLEIAEFIKRGHVGKNGGELFLKFAVFTKEQYENLKILTDDVMNTIAEKMLEIVKIAADILVQHTPVSMKKEAENICWTKLRDCATVPVKIMLDNGILQQVAENEHPATFIILA
jgi:hypothetical protein